MEKEYIIVGSNNFWYASGNKSLNEARKDIRYIKKHHSEYGDPESLDKDLKRENKNV